MNLISAFSLALWYAFVPVALAQDTIRLLEPLNGSQELPVGDNPLGALGYYIDTLYPWLLGMGAAVAVLRTVWAGVQIMQAGSDTAELTKQKNTLLLSIGGLLMVLLAGTILKAINPTFFK